MAGLTETFCFVQTKPSGSYTPEFSLDGQRFRSPIFAPMHGCVAGQALAPGQCREPQLRGCASDPWGWTAGQQGCINSTLCSPDSAPKFTCTRGTCMTLPNKQPGCQAPAFRKTFAGNVAKSNFNLPNVQTLPYRLPASEIPAAKPFCWTANRSIALLRSPRPGFNLTMYNQK